MRKARVGQARHEKDNRAEREKDDGIKVVLFHRARRVALKRSRIKMKDLDGRITWSHKNCIL